MLGAEVGVGPGGNHVGDRARLNGLQAKLQLAAIARLQVADRIFQFAAAGMFQSGGDMLGQHHAGGHAAAGIRYGERERRIVAHEYAVGAGGLDDQLRPGDDRSGRGVGLEADGRHAADFALFGRHDLHFDRRSAARLERAQRPDQFSPRTLRCRRSGAQQTRAAGNLVVNLDLAGSHRAGVPHDDSQHGRPPHLDLRRGDLLDDHLRALGAFKLLAARLAGAVGDRVVSFCRILRHGVTDRAGKIRVPGIGRGQAAGLSERGTADLRVVRAAIGAAAAWDSGFPQAVRERHSGRPLPA